MTQRLSNTSASSVGRELPQPVPADQEGRDSNEEASEDTTNFCASFSLRSGRPSLNQGSVHSAYRHLGHRTAMSLRFQTCRPFVWEDTKVRNLLDSCLPAVGTLVLWQTGTDKEARAA